MADTAKGRPDCLSEKDRYGHLSETEYRQTGKKNSHSTGEERHGARIVRV
jgi:hypothetical protein